jgi:hypothetical protein
MIVRELIEAVLKQPALLEAKLEIAVSSELVTYRVWNGAVEVATRPVEAILAGRDSVLLFTNPGVPAVTLTFEKCPSPSLYGPAPDAPGTLPLDVSR